jgi:hypothetical protein
MSSAGVVRAQAEPMGLTGLAKIMVESSIVADSFCWAEGEARSMASADRMR